MNKLNSNAYEFFRDFLRQNYENSSISTHLIASAIILKSASFLYDKSVLDEILSEILRIIKSEKESKIYDYFFEILGGKGFEDILSSINFIRQNADITDSYGGIQFKNFMQNYEYFLGDISGFYRDSDLPIEVVLPSLMRKKIVELRLILRKFNEDSTNFAELSETFLTCDFFIRNFAQNFELKASKILEKTAIKTAKFDKLLAILHFLEEYGESLGDTKSVSREISMQIFKIKDRIVDNKEKFSLILGFYSRNLRKFYKD